jgi:hypothetical protein
MTNHDEKVESLISAGADIAGAAVGGALGFIAAGPVGAASAGVVGVGITRVLRDVTSRFLSGRETARIGATAATAISAIQERLNDGQKVRDDGFFDPDEQKQSPAEDVFEGVLLASKRTNEAKKAKYLGQLFANVAFDVTCLTNEANYHIHVAESLTYAQFVLLHLFSQRDNRFRLRSSSYGAGAQVHYATISLLHAIHELCDLNLVVMQKPSEPHHTIVLGINIISPADLRLAVGGQRLHDLLGLQSMSAEDINDVARWLQ